MELGKCTNRLFIISCFILIASLILITELHEVSGDSPEREIRHDVIIENLTYFTLNSTVDLYFLNGLNASAFREEYWNASPEYRQENITLLESSIHDIAHDALMVLFNGSYAFDTRIEIDMDSLENSNPPEAPIRLNASSSANLSRTSYDLPENAILEDVIYGTFKMGAVIRLQVHLIAPARSLTHYIFTPWEGIVIEEHTTGIHEDNTVRWVLDNADGYAPERDEDLRLESQYPTIIHDEDVRVTIELDRQEFELTTVRVDIEVYAVQVSRYGNLSNSIVRLDYIPADGIRMVVDNGLINWSWEHIYEENIQPSEGEIEASISKALNVTVELNFNWENASITGYDIDTMGTEPPVQGKLISEDITPHLYAIGNDSYGVDDIKVAKGFLNAGGRAEFEIPEIDLELWVIPKAKLILSPNMQLMNYTGTQNLDPDNRYSYSWDPREEFKGIIYSSTKYNKYNSSRIEVDIIIDIKDISINWLDLQSSDVDIDIIGNLHFYRMETPSQIIDSLPDGIWIDYIISDVLRLAYDTGLIDLDEINEIVENRTEEIEREIRDAFEENAYLSIKVDEKSLLGYDVDDMKESPPIRIKGMAFISIKFAEGFGSSDDDNENCDNGGVGDGGAFLYYVLREFTWEIPMEPIEDWIISYTLILPKGIVVTDVYDDLGQVEEGSMDGRDSITVTITDRENNITVTIGITPMFFIDLCMLPIMIIVIILFLIIMRKRGKKKRKKEEEEMLLLKLHDLENRVSGRFQQNTDMDESGADDGKEEPRETEKMSRRERKKSR